MDQAWFDLLMEVIDRGERSAARAACQPASLLSHTLAVHMSYPVLTIARRQLGYRFMCAEAAWILSGDKPCRAIAPYSKTISQFSDDGVTFLRGLRAKDQGSARACDRAPSPVNPDTRQAVINIWREDPPHTKDMPCTISCQFMIREDLLHCFVTMRSSDVWLGVPYDVFNFSMLSGYVLIRAREPRPSARRSVQRRGEPPPIRPQLRRSKSVRVRLVARL